MVPNVNQTSKGLGTSFKGVADYCLHDKREDGAESGPHPTTSIRVAWTSTRNLDPELSTGALVAMMAATAEHAEDLKRSAGLSTKGRKLEKPVFHYSLSWHPDERPSRDEMEQAVTESLQALGAEGLQSIIVCHNDEPQPHVHVILNRVDPEDGRALSTSNNFLKLSDWANDWERRHGKIWTPKREERRQKRERHADRAERRAYAEQQRIAAAERAHDTESQVAHLKQLGADQRQRHKDQWKRFGQVGREQRKRIYEHFGTRIKKAIERHKIECKPIWRRHFEMRRYEKRLYAYRERTIAGQLRNAYEATKHQRDTGELGDRSMFAATMRNFFLSEARWKLFLEAGELTKRDLSERLKSVLDDEISDIKGERLKALAAQREASGTARADLIARQDAARAKLRDAWRTIRPARPAGSKPHWRRKTGEGPSYGRDCAPAVTEDRKGLFGRMKNLKITRREGRTSDAAAERIEKEQQPKPGPKAGPGVGH